MRPVAAIHGMRISAPGAEVLLRPDDEGGAGLVKPVEALEIHVPPVEHVDRAGLRD